MTVTEALEIRRATPSFDPSAQISPEELEHLLDLANLAPSSGNLQPWRYLVCRTQDERDRLKAASFNQKKIGEAGVVLMVLGDMEHHVHHAEEVVDSQIKNGYLPEEKREAATERQKNAFTTERAKRDECFRGSAIWGMAFMLVAAEAGWATAPMGGYEPDKVREAFDLPESLVPTLIICIGKPNPDVKILPRNVRFPARELAINGKL